MEAKKEINLSDFTYFLPKEKIAQHPLKDRDKAKLQVYQRGKITHTNFYSIHDFIKKNSLIVFNDTKVINARLFFKKSTGAKIEVFLLEPVSPYPIDIALDTTFFCVWKCIIRNKNKWRNKDILTLKINSLNLILKSVIVDRENQYIGLYWDNPKISFSTIIDEIGKTPLPPYIKRIPDEEDAIRYQTIYSKQNGAVAAPTAGLHFSKNVMDNLVSKGIEIDFVTLHVGAGTFLPIKEDNVVNHLMHSEEIVIGVENLKKLIKFSEKVIAVGTTSMRVLESLYWLGVKILKNPEKLSSDKNIDFEIGKLSPYDNTIDAITTSEALNAILLFMKEKNVQRLVGHTEIFILPGYEFKLCSALITNYHMPDTTLILLVAAFIGEDWRKVYDEALENDYRFLSYGDSSLLIP